MLHLEDQRKIVDAISHKIGQIKCPMCQGTKFVLAEGYINNTLQSDFNKVSLGGPSIPSAPIICENCGFISHHALGVLGLLPNKEKEKTPSTK